MNFLRPTSRPARPSLLRLFVAVALSVPGFALGNELPPFDFSDPFLLANGINPVGLIARPNGTLPGSVIDDTPNGPDFRNVRVLELTAAFDHSGHPIFFYVTGLVFPQTFTNDAAGAEAREIAEEFKVYEFPRAANPPGAVFPKRQDLIADLSGGYFSNDPLGIWQVNIVKFTPAAFNTGAGRQELAELAARNGLDLDGTPLIRTKSEVESLADDGLVTIEIPPADGVALRWFLCPVLEDPRDGAITQDAHLNIVLDPDGTPLDAQQDIYDMFHCLQETGDECDVGEFNGSIGTFGFASTTTCPCANFAGAAGSSVGCVNSTGQGGRLAGNGSARLSNDSVVLAGSQMPNAPALYLQGTVLASVVLGDGLRVVGGSLVRLGTRINANGGSTFPAAGQDLSALGGVTLPGTRYYQVWYRDPAAFCTSDAFNLTNGVRVTWAP